MSLKKTLEDYISAQEKHKKFEHELKELEVDLANECRIILSLKHSGTNIEKNICKLATILLGKLQ